MCLFLKTMSLAFMKFPKDSMMQKRLIMTAIELRDRFFYGSQGGSKGEFCRRKTESRFQSLLNLMCGLSRFKSSQSLSVFPQTNWKAELRRGEGLGSCVALMAA